MTGPTTEAALREAQDRAEKALRTPDLEWARDLVHGLARDSLTLIAALRERPSDVALVEALEAIRDAEPDRSSRDQTAYFWTWAKRTARDALAAARPDAEREP